MVPQVPEMLHVTAQFTPAFDASPVTLALKVAVPFSATLAGAVTLTEMVDVDAIVTSAVADWTDAVPSVAVAVAVMDTELRPFADVGGW
jgi:hypothetical protein